MAKASRQRTPVEFLSDARELDRLLERALNRWDDGDSDAIRDVASYTRTLLAFGRGDGLLRRVASAYRISVPSVRVFQQVEVGRDIYMAVGGMPADDHDDDTNIVELEILQWLSQTVVELSDGARKRTSWAHFISDYGNTFGAHSSETIPEVLERVTIFQGPNGHMGGYALRAAAVVAERLLNHVLSEIDGTEPRDSRMVHVGGITVTGFAIGGAAPHWHGFGLSIAIPGEFVVLAMPFNDARVEVGWSWDGGPSGGSLSLNLNALA